jgi:Holliday junction resolvase RusA-like endonuclease
MIRDRVTYMVRPGAEPEAFVWAVECQIFVLDPKSPEGTFCGLMPDTDNVIKSVLDAAQACFGNDSRVSYEAGWKWTTRDHAKAGVGLTIWPLGIWRQGDQEEIPSEWREKRDYWEGKRT